MRAPSSAETPHFRAGGGFDSRSTLKKDDSKEELDTTQEKSFTGNQYPPAKLNNQRRDEPEATISVADTAEFTTFNQNNKFNNPGLDPT